MAAKSPHRGKVNPGQALDAIDQAALDAATAAVITAARAVVDNPALPRHHPAITRLSNALIALDRRQHNTRPDP